MIGTRDFSAFLTIPACIEFMQQYNWREVRKACHQMVLQYAPAFYDCLGTSAISPLNASWIGQMISLPIRTQQPEVLQKTLFNQYKIEVPLMRQGDDVYLRYSIQAFNTADDLEILLDTLRLLKKQGTLIQ
jgi:isopenicillin-N epimerase